jgi:hypothetical protein
VPVSVRTLLARSSTVLALVLTGGLGLVGGVSLRGPGTAAVVLVAVAAACVGAGMTRESAAVDPRAATAEAAWRSAVGTVAVVLVLVGSIVLAGGAAPVVVVPWAAAVALAGWLRRNDRRARPGSRPTGAVSGDHRAARPTVDRSSRSGRHPSARGAGPPPAVSRPSPDGPPGGTAPLPGPGPDLTRLSTEALGQEWLRTSAALGSTADPATRGHVVQRRVAALDELERRDPAGFARWLAAGATADSNPAQYLRGDSSAGSGTA